MFIAWAKKWASCLMSTESSAQTVHVKLRKADERERKERGGGGITKPENMDMAIVHILGEKNHIYFYL